MELICMQSKAVPVSKRQLLVIFVACAMAFASLTLAPITAQANFSVSVNTIVLNEDDAAPSKFDVALASQPTGKVVVTVKSSNYDKVRLKSDPGPATLHFTPANWNVPKTVQVIPQQDDDNNDDSITLTIDSSSSQSFTPATSTVAVAILDDDDNSDILRSTSSITIYENDTNSRYLAKYLPSQPPTNVEVTFTSSNYDKLRLNNKPTSVTLTFTPSTWDVAQYVELSPQQDPDVLNESVVVTQTHSWVSPGSKRIFTTLVNVIDNDEVPRLLLAEKSKSVNENDTSPAEVDVTLSSQPMGNIYVTIKSSNYDKLRLKSDPGVVNLTFTPLNWNVPKTIHIYPQQNADTIDDSATVTLTPSGNDYPVLSQATISVGIVDDDTIITKPISEPENQNRFNVQVSKQSITVNENDASPTAFNLVLTEQPSSDIEVTIVSSNYDKVRLKHDPGPANLTFTPLNWKTSKSVQIVPQQDNDSSDESVTLTLTVTDDSESSVNLTVSVTVIDDEKIPVLLLSEQSITVNEGNADPTEFDIVLSSRPAGNVDVTIESSNYEKILLKSDPGMVTINFTPLNWNTKRSVQVFPQSDSDTSNDSVNLNFEVLWNDGQQSSQMTIPVTVIDANHSSTLSSTESLETENRLSKAWLGHFGNSVGDQVLDSVISRMSISPTPGTYGVIAGTEFGNYPDSTPSSYLLDSSQNKNNPVEVLPMIEVLDGAALTATQKPDASGGVLTAWGKFSVSGFESKSKGNETKGDIQTAMLGVDYASSDWLFGLILSRNNGDGTYVGRESTVPERLRSALSTATLFGSFDASDRMTIWGATGTGSGDISIKGSSRDLQAKSKLKWRMVAMGFRNTIGELSHERGSTTFSGDFMGVKTSAQKAVGISATDAKNSRFRVAIDHSRRNSPSNGWANSQKVRLGLITNDGDAAEGVGTEVGGSMTWHSPNRKLMLNLDGRIVVSHGDNSYKNWNYSAELASGPTVSSPMGLSFSLRQNWQSQSPDAFNLMSTSSIWERIPDTDAGKTLTFNLAYGFPIAGGRLVGSPYLSLGSSHTAQEFAVGWRAETVGLNTPDSAFDVRINQHNPDTGNSDNGIALQFRSDW